MPFILERKCAFTAPGSEWKVSPLFAGDRVVIATTAKSQNRSGRAYLRANENGFIEYTGNRADATVFRVYSTTYERDALREQNELEFVVDATGHPVYILLDGTNRLQVFAEVPERTHAAPVRFVPSLVTKERKDRKFTKSGSLSPFDGSAGGSASGPNASGSAGGEPNTSKDKLNTGEGPLFHYGDSVLFRIPRFENTEFYEYISCRDEGQPCALPKLTRTVDDPEGVKIAKAALDNALSKSPQIRREVLEAQIALQRAQTGKFVRDENTDEAQTFSFQCPSGGLIYYTETEVKPGNVPQFTPAPPPPSPFPSPVKVSDLKTGPPPVPFEEMEKLRVIIVNSPPFVVGRPTDDRRHPTEIDVVKWIRFYRKLLSAGSPDHAPTREAIKEKVEQLLRYKQDTKGTFSAKILEEIRGASKLLQLSPETVKQLQNPSLISIKWIGIDEGLEDISPLEISDVIDDVPVESLRSRGYSSIYAVPGAGSAGASSSAGKDTIVTDKSIAKEAAATLPVVERDEPNKEEDKAPVSGEKATEDQGGTVPWYKTPAFLSSIGILAVLVLIALIFAVVAVVIRARRKKMASRGLSATQSPSNLDK